jgi:hypothetical protein
MKTNPLATIRKRQTLFRSLTGITQEKFDELLKKQSHYMNRKRQKDYTEKKEKENKVGAGRSN